MEFPKFGVIGSSFTAPTSSVLGSSFIAPRELRNVAGFVFSAFLTASVKPFSRKCAQHDSSCPVILLVWFQTDKARDMVRRIRVGTLALVGSPWIQEPGVNE